MTASPPPTAHYAADDLFAALSRLQAITRQRTSIPVLRYVLLDMWPGVTTLSATDLDLELRIEIDGDNPRQPFSVMINPEPVLRFLRGSTKLASLALIADDLLELRNEGRTLRMRQVVPVADYPGTPAAHGEAFHIGASTLRKALTTCLTAVSTDETRYYLNGVHITSRGAELVLEATDGHRCAQHVERVGRAWSLGNYILPTAAAKLLVQLIPRGENAIAAIRAGGPSRSLQISCRRWSLFAKTIDGTFPDTRRIMPRGEEVSSFTVDAAMLRPFLAPGRLEPFIVDPSAGVAWSHDPDTGYEISAPIAATGERVGFSPRYLHDFARLHGTLRVVSYDDRGGARVFCEDPSTTLIVMPMRIATFKRMSTQESK